MKNTIITFRAPGPDKHQLTSLSKESGISKSECCRLALRIFLNEFKADYNKLWQEYENLKRQDQDRFLRDKWETNNPVNNDPLDGEF